MHTVFMLKPTRSKNQLAQQLTDERNADLRLRFFSLQLDTSLHCHTADIREMMHRAVCLFTPKLSPMLTADNVIINAIKTFCH